MGLRTEIAYEMGTEWLIREVDGHDGVYNPYILDWHGRARKSMGGVNSRGKPTLAWRRSPNRAKLGLFMESQRRTCSAKGWLLRLEKLPKIRVRTRPQ